MEPNPLDLPTSPSVPLPSVPSPQPPWPDQAGGQPPSGRPRWPLLAAIGAGLAVVVIVALLFTLLVSARGGTTTILLGAAAEQTATASKVQATSTAEGTPPTSPTGTVARRATATPKPFPSVHIATAQANAVTGAPATASCPSEEVALSGGWTTDVSTPIFSSSCSGDGWRVSPRSQFGAHVTAYAMCLQHVVGATVTERSVHIPVAANNTGYREVTCNQGKFIVGGGFVIPTTGVELESLDGDHYGTTLFGTVINHNSSPQVVTVYIECLRAPGMDFIPPQNGGGTLINSGANGTLSASCRQGALLTGAGFSVSDSIAAVVYDFSPSSATIWHMHFKNQSATTMSVGIRTFCLFVA